MAISYPLHCILGVGMVFAVQIVLLFYNKSLFFFFFSPFLQVPRGSILDSPFLSPSFSSIHLISSPDSELLASSIYKPSLNTGVHQSTISSIGARFSRKSASNPMLATPMPIILNKKAHEKFYLPQHLLFNPTTVKNPTHLRQNK